MVVTRKNALLLTTTNQPIDQLLQSEIAGQSFDYTLWITIQQYESVGDGIEVMVIIIPDDLDHLEVF